MAYKIIIADDEPVEREALKLFISREFPDLEICGEASNGIEFLDIVNSQHPDIAVVDINMPALGGLEAIRTLRLKENQLKCIIHTAYSEFDFAQQALDLGVISYLLKPVNKKNLYLVIKKILETLRVEKNRQKLENRNEVILKESEHIIEEEIVDSIYLNTISEEYINSYLHKQEEDFNGFIIVSIKNEYMDQDLSTSHMRFIVKAFIPTIIGRCVNGSIIAIILVSNIQTKIVRNRWIATVCQQIQNSIGNMHTLYFGISQYFENISNLHKAFTQSQGALVATSNSSRIAFYSGNAEHYTKTGINSNSLVNFINDSFFRQDKTTRIEFIERLVFDYALTVGHDLYKLKEYALSLYTQIEETLSQDDEPYTSLETLVSLKGANSKNEIVEWLLRQINILTKQYMEWKYSNMNISIKEALNFIRMEFHRNISLDYVASKIGLSSYYFSHLFKKETGKTYIQYLTEYRIEEGRKLIGRKKFSLAEIAYKCGYSNPHYFSKVYYRITGVKIANKNGICREIKSLQEQK